MKSPFPGMDPFLEGYLWPDLHGSLAHVIKELLAPLVSPKYVARTDVYNVQDTAPEEDIGILYPDVELLRRKDTPSNVKLGDTSYKTTTLTPSSIVIPAINPVEVRVPVVKIRDRASNVLVTAIEILSPVNKRNPGIKPYREKRKNLHQAQVHLIEIDLLRRGERPFKHPQLPINHYFVNLIRAESWNTEVWDFSIKDKLPVLPIPLRKPDKDIHLDLGKAFQITYERSHYHLSINYQETPPPPIFQDSELEWISNLVKNAK